MKLISVRTLGDGTRVLVLSDVRGDGLAQVSEPGSGEFLFLFEHENTNPSARCIEAAMAALEAMRQGLMKELDVPTAVEPADVAVSRQCTAGAISYLREVVRSTRDMLELVKQRCTLNTSKLPLHVQLAGLFGQLIGVEGAIAALEGKDLRTLAPFQQPSPAIRPTQPSAEA